MSLGLNHIIVVFNLHTTAGTIDSSSVCAYVSSSDATHIVPHPYHYKLHLGRREVAAASFETTVLTCTCKLFKCHLPVKTPNYHARMHDHLLFPVASLASLPGLGFPSSSLFEPMELIMAEAG